MIHPARLLRRLRSLMSTRRFDDELDEELRFHVDMEAARLVRDGIPASEARMRALHAFGGVSRHRDDARDARGVRPVEDFAHDVRIGLRSLGRQRTFAAVAILTLAVGIGGTTALGSGVYHVLLAPLPFPNAEQLVVLQQIDTRRGELQSVASGNFIDIRQRARAFTHLAAAEPFSFDWVGPERAVEFGSAFVTDGFFRMQGLRPVVGRAFVSTDFEPSNANVVLLSEGLWRTRFGADSSLVGRVLVLDSVPRVVVGVMPDDGLRPFAADMYAPKIYREDEITARTAGYWEILGRLAPGVTLGRANAELRAIAAQLAEQYPATNSSTGFSAQPLRESLVAGAREPLLILLGAVLFVMLIACVNVASLQLAEVVRRRGEIAIRAAVGAGRGRLVRQVLTESLLLAIIGSAAGLTIAYAGIAAIRAFSPPELWQLADLVFDGSAVGLALSLALVATLVIGTVPVAAIAHVRLAESLAAGGRDGSVGRSRQRISRALVLAEVSLALVLLVGAGLLLRSLSGVASTNPGFVARGVHAFTTQLWTYYPTGESRNAFVRLAEERLRAIPGVESVGVTSVLPLDYPIGLERVRVEIEGHPTMPGEEPPTVRTSSITTGALDALRIPLRDGRVFTSNDRAGTTPVALVNETFVRRFFPGESAIGKRVVLGFQSQPIAREIVGVVGDVRRDGLDIAPAPGIYLPHSQASTGAVHFVVRAPSVASIDRQVRDLFVELNGAMPLSEITSMEALVRRSLAQRRFQLGLLACFSMTALLLAAIGIYGVMSRATSERTHEIGVRMAMGARAGDVRWMVLRSGGVLAIAGVALGLGAAFPLTRTMRGMLFGVGPLDPLTYAAAAAILVVVALGATLVPAWRASTVSPVIALRNN